MSKQSKPAIVAVVIVVLTLAAGGLWWFLRDDSPPEVNLDTAAKGVTSSTTNGSGTAKTDPTAAATDIDGTWTVDATSGAFDYESATGTFVGFRIQENLVNVGANTAVGRTNAVTGTMKIEGTKVTEASFTVDLTKLTSNDSSGFRDRRVQEALGTGQFPNATFELTQPIELGPNASDGSEVKVTAKGDLTIHGVTKPVELPLQAKLVDGTVVVVGSMEVTFADFDVKVPSAPVLLSVDDHGILELQLLLTKS